MLLRLFFCFVFLQYNCNDLCAGKKLINAER